MTGPFSRDQTEYRVITTVICLLCAAGFASGFVPVVEHIVGAVLVAGVLVAAAVWWVRRELRIRRRQADPRYRFHPNHPRSRVRVGQATAGSDLGQWR